jgi:peptidoglycan/xylan/chitin deacetylase (PgdA/CDA1 family)
MRSLAIFFALAAVVVPGASTSSAACANPAGIGVSRTLAVDTASGLEVGSMQYKGRLALADMEVVLTFDDGPIPGPSERVLEALGAACAKATFFVVGQMARAHPQVLRREAAAGHTIATHTWRHPDSLAQLPYDSAVREIDKGIAAVAAALGRQPAPFFRFPGLGDSRALRRYLASAGIGVFSADVVGSDWTGISGDQIRQNVMRRLKAHRGGIVLLHDTKRATARMLPQLLADMKAAGFRLVHIVPRGRGIGPVAIALL